MTRTDHGIHPLDSSFPDAIADVDLRIEDQVAEGDRVVTRGEIELLTKGKQDERN